MGVVLAVNGEMVEGRNSFITFHLICILLPQLRVHVKLSYCPFLCGIRVTQKANLYCIINNNVFFCIRIQLHWNFVCVCVC